MDQPNCQEAQRMRERQRQEVYINWVRGHRQIAILAEFFQGCRIFAPPFTTGGRNLARLKDWPKATDLAIGIFEPTAWRRKC